MPRSAVHVVLRDGDGERLRSLTRASTAPAGLVQRARIVLLAAERTSNTDIAAQVGVARQTVVTWRQRYVDGGMAALQDGDRPGRPPVHDDVAVVVATLEPPPGGLGVTHAGVTSERTMHGRGSIEYMSVVAGEVILVAQNTQLELGCGDVARFAADGEHVYRTAAAAARLLTVVHTGDD